MNISLSFHYQKTLCLSLSPMALSDKSSRQPLIPSFLYSSSSTVSTSHKSFGLDKTMLGAAAPASSNNGVSSPTRNFIVRAARSRRTRRPSTPPVPPAVFSAVVSLTWPSLLSISSSAICRSDSSRSRSLPFSASFSSIWFYFTFLYSD